MLWRVADLAKIDISVPHPARVYDYWLGGKDNFEADRQAARAAIEIFPHTVQSAVACRAFLARVVHYLAAGAARRRADLEVRPRSDLEAKAQAALWGGVARKPGP